MLNFPELPLHVGEIEPCEILYFPKKKIQLLCKETDQTYRWLFHIANINALSFFQEKKIPYYESETRVIYYLLDLARLINKSDGTLPRINITQQLLSELCGVSRPSVNQVLKGLEEANLIKVGRSNIKLTDFQGLRDKLADVNLIFNDPFPIPL
ncbi:Crp/Fnr family transcriptional regulator [Thalassotalea psychrophila]|uniref:Crp/Fnr family transcriptional regulator n=1 Tax=Thalassotalea psychrophila TaxID=3065647 RepID=A0ABY9TP08_9GAMM|nr:Crp/Fnr family transcriptional regulator [Colwelliaceae bacterium SQ149]